MRSIPSGQDIIPARRGLRETRDGSKLLTSALRYVSHPRPPNNLTPPDHPGKPRQPPAARNTAISNPRPRTGRTDAHPSLETKPATSSANYLSSEETSVEALTFSVQESDGSGGGVRRGR